LAQSHFVLGILWFVGHAGAGLSMTYKNPAKNFAENEVLIKDAVCVAQRDRQLESTIGTQPIGTPPFPTTGEPFPTPIPEKKANVRDQLDLRFPVPMGKVAQIMGMMNFLQSKFKELEIEIRAKNGSISEEEFANKIKEALRQLDISLED